MRDLLNKSTIWKFVGCASAISGLVCFALSSTYDMSFEKLGFGGHLVYLLVSLMMWWLIARGKRIRVSEKVQGVVAALIFVVVCLILVVHDKLVTGKSDMLSIISYGSFALMSLSMSRKFELGFETGFSAFFLQLLATQLYKIKWMLLPVALVFCSLIIILRHYSESGGQSSSINPNGYHRLLEVGPPNAVVIDIGNEDSNEESQDSRGMGGVSMQSLLSTNYNQHQEESTQATHHSVSHNGQVSEGSTLDWVYEQNNEEEEDGGSLAAESSENNTVAIQNGWMHNSPEPELVSATRRVLL